MSSRSSKITREILIHTSNSITKNKTAEGHVIRNWKIFIEPATKTYPNGEVKKLTLNYIESVTYKLHESFANSVRVLKESPFELRERGWGEFDMLITISFVNSLYPPISIPHFLSFTPAPDIKPYKLEFINPKPDLKKLLVMTQQSPNSGQNNSDIDAMSGSRNTSSKSIPVAVKRNKPQPPPQRKQHSQSPSPAPKAIYVEEPNAKQKTKKRPVNISDSDTSDDDDVQNPKFSRGALSEIIPQLRGPHVLEAIEIIRKGTNSMPAPSKNHLQLDLYQLSKPSLLDLWDHCHNSLRFYKDLDQFEREQNIEIGSKKAWDVYVAKQRRSLVEEASDSSASEEETQLSKRHKSRDDRKLNQSPISDSKPKKSHTNTGSDERESFDRSGKSLPLKNEQNNSANINRSRSKESSVSRNRYQISPIHATESQGSYSKRSSVNHSPVRSSVIDRARDGNGAIHSRNHSPERHHGSTRNSSRNRSPEKEHRRDRDADRNRPKDRSGTTTRDRSRDRDRSKDRYERYNRPDSARERERDREKGRGERERERDRERSNTYGASKDSDNRKDKRGGYKPSDYYDGAAGRRNTEYRGATNSNNQRYR